MKLMIYSSMLSRRAFLGTTAATLLKGATPKPNFLFIHADDHAGYVLGCDGNPQAQTPNLDAFASQGVRFERHYCNSPLCTPSRQSFFTGEMPSTCGVTLLNTALAPTAQTLAVQFRDAGYTTGVFGKMHFNANSYPGMHGFDGLILETDLPSADS